MAAAARLVLVILMAVWTMITLVFDAVMWFRVPDISGFMVALWIASWAIVMLPLWLIHYVIRPRAPKHSPA